MGRNLGLNPGEPEYFVRISHLVGNLQSQVVNLIFPDTSARHFFCILIPCSTIKKNYFDIRTKTVWQIFKLSTPPWGDQVAYLVIVTLFQTVNASEIILSMRTKSAQTQSS